MAFSNGPITTLSGLVFNLDAADRNSYPGSGITWFNTAGSGYAGTFTNSPVFTGSLNQGAVGFNGLNSYVSVAGLTSNNDNAWTADGSVGSSTVCYEIWVNTTDTAGRIISKPWNGGGQYNINLSFGSWTLMVGANLSNTISFANAINNGVWRQAVVWATSTQIGYYLDGGAYSGAQNHGLTGGAGSSGNGQETLLIMSLYPYGEGWAGNTSFSVLGSVAVFRKYNRVLSIGEVRDNYNALKGRFNRT